jgi:hypothetical protein
MARIRSPNYPALSLPDALARVAKIHNAEQHLAAPREVIVKHLGYGGLNGASIKVLSAIQKYGLIEEVAGDRVRVSQLAVAILHPGSDKEKSDAIKTAAFMPPLFSEMASEWEGQQPSDHNLRSYLIRRNFAQDALDRVIQSYRETIELVARESGAYDSPEAEPVASDAVVSPMSGNLQAAEPASPTKGADAFRLAFTPSGGLEGGFRIGSEKELDDLVSALSGMKFIFKMAREIPPTGES